MESIELTARARAAYERGRWRVAFVEALGVAPLVVLAMLRCQHPTPTCVASLALVAAVVVLRWRGGVWGRAVLPALLAALPAMVLPALLPAAWMACAPACALICPVTGLLAGAQLGRWVARQNAERDRALLAGGILLLACGALGCGVLGVGAVAGMWLGAGVGGLVFARASS